MPNIPIAGGTRKITRNVREPKYEYWLGAQRTEPIQFIKGRKVTDNGDVTDEGSWYTGYYRVPSGDEFIFNKINANITIAFYYGVSIGTKPVPPDFPTKSIKRGYIEVPEGANYFVLSCSQSDAAFAAELERNNITPYLTKVGDKFTSDQFYVMKRCAPFCRNLAKKYTRESGWFFTRQSLSGTLSFHGIEPGDAFDTIWKAPHDADFIFLIRRLHRALDMENTDKWENYITGVFAKTDCTFDYGKKKCTPKIEALDDYKDLLDRWEDEVDLVKLGTPRTTIKDMALRPVVQTYVAGSKTVCNFYGAAYQDTEADEAVDYNYGDTGYDANSASQPLAKKYGFRCVGVYDEFVISAFDENSVDAVMNGRYVRVADSNYSNVSLQPSGNTDTASDRIGYRRWVNENGCACRVSLVVAQTNNSVTVTMQIFASLADSNTAGATVLAVSRNLNCEGYPGAHVLLLGLWGLDRFFPTQASANPHQFHSLATGANRAVSECFSQYIYQRVLSVKDKYGSTNGVKLTEDDPFYEGGNYKYAIPYLIGSFCMSAEKSQDVTPFGIDDNNKYFVMPEAITGYTNVQSLRPLCKDSWGMASLWWSATAYKTAYIGGTPPPGFDIYASVLNDLTETYDHRDAFFIHDALTKTLKAIGCGVNHLKNANGSRFLYDTMPVSGAASFGVFVTQKTNVLKGKYDQPAQKCPVTLKGLLEMLRDVFQCYWYIYNGNLVIEHVSYFLNGNTYYVRDVSPVYDFTELKDRFNNMPTAYFQTQLSFDREGSQVPREYALNFGEESSSVFDDVHIRLLGKNVDTGKKEEVTVTDVCADVDLMHARPGDFSEEGLALLCPAKATGAWTMTRISVAGLRDEYGNGFSPTVQNWYASLIYSAMMFYKYGLPAARYFIDKVAQSEFTVPDGYVKKIASQTLRFPSEDDPLENERIKTEIGTGEIEGMSVDLDSRTVEATVAYDPTKITNV